MSTTTTTQIPAEVSAFYNRTLLDRAVALFLHTMFAQVKDIPRNAGTNVIKFRRYGNLTAATTALTEGVTPAGSSLSVTDISATVAQYGDFVTVSDVVDYSSQDAVLMEAAEILGDQAGDTLDQLARDVIAAGTSASYSGTSNTQTSHVAAGDVIDLNDIKDAVKTLKNNNAKRITRMVNPSTGYSTEPVDAAYVGIVHPNITYTLKTLTGWTPVEKYGSQTKLMPGEVGKIEEVRFVETTNAKVKTGQGTGSIDVYCTIILGQNAYGTSRISGEAMKNIIKPLGSAGSADPLDQRATSGWKATFVAKILNDNFLTRIESAQV